jgi:hypothetical protein
VTFTIGQILSVYTGKLMCPLEDLYGALRFLHGGVPIFTHQIPRACRDSQAWFEESLPWLKQRSVDCAEVTPQNFRERLEFYAEEFGQQHEVSPIPFAEQLKRDPIQEAEEMAPGRVIVVEE